MKILEGRWAKLTLSAFAKGCIDYSVTTRRKWSSILKESLLLREMQNERLERLASIKLLAQAVLNPDDAKVAEKTLHELTRMSVPWLLPAGDLEYIPQTEVNRMVELYKKYKERKLVK